MAGDGGSRVGGRRLGAGVAAGIAALSGVGVYVTISQSDRAQAWSGFDCSFPDYQHAVDPIPYGLFQPSFYGTYISDAVNAWNSSGAGTYINVQPGTYWYQDQIYVANYGNVSWSGQVDQWNCNVFTRDWDYPPRMRINQYYTDNYKSVDVMGVIVHEFGHSIGLAHVPASCSSNSSMVPDDMTRRNCGFQAPHGDDVVGVSALYPSWK